MPAKAIITAAGSERNVSYGEEESMGGHWVGIIYETANSSTRRDHEYDCKSETHNLNEAAKLDRPANCGF